MKGMNDEVAGKGHCCFWQRIIEEDSQCMKSEWTKVARHIDQLSEGRALEAEGI